MLKMIRTNLQLRNEMKGMGKQIVDLRGDVGKLTCERAFMADKAVRLEQTLMERDAELKAVTAERDKLSKLVREQTRADLLLNALESIGIVRDDRRSDDYIAEAARLSDIQRQMGSPRQGLPYGTGNPFGLSGVFGSGIIL